MTFADYMRTCATEYLAALMVKHDGKVRAAAQEARMHRTAFYRLLHRCGLQPPRRGNGHRSKDATWAMQ